ncbi:MAG: ABC-F family ATP-binding cassette domain-containing protein [Alphaproteobacteria bacterium]|nr:ABC-F family ATP-binding cassette domain-containing protein [Alphaproteobacteria bacterium]
MAFISLSNVFFSYDSANDLFANLSVSFNDYERVAIIGDNGCGKTTLLKIMAGEITPDSGTVTRDACIYYMPQIQMHDSKSGGERQSFALARAFDSGAEILLLDEPTNNLDTDARQRFFSALESYPFGVVIVSHDRELLQHMDKIIEMTNGQLRVYGGNYDFYVNQKRIESENLQSKYTDSEKKIRRLNKTLDIAQNTRQHHEIKQHKDVANGRRSPIAANALKGKSQETEAKKRNIITKKLDEQRAIQQSLTEQMREDKIKIPLPSKPFYSKELVSISGLHFAYGNRVIFDDFDFTMYGRTRVRLCGKNGAGKTTLIKIICGELTANSGVVKTFGKIAYLNQDLSVLDRNKTIVENIMDISGCLKHDAHMIAANFGFRGDTSSKRVSMLSGGELLKATLAAILGGENQPDLLILDEPTNNLEIKSIAILEDALNQYRGAILLVSHDEIFAKNIKVDGEINIRPIRAK